MMDKKQPTGWCLVPPTIMAIEDLTSSDKLVYGRINGLLQDKGYCYASNAWLGKQIGLKPGTISNIISKLSKRKLIQVQVVRDDNNRITERRIFVPGFTQKLIGINLDVDRGIHAEVEGSNRDKRVDKSNNNRQAVVDENVDNFKKDVDKSDNKTKADILKGMGFDVKKGGATYEWQDKAARYWKALVKSGNPTPSWFKLFKRAYNSNKQGLLDSAFTAVIDANADNPELYFYKVFNAKLNGS